MKSSPKSPHTPLKVAIACGGTGGHLFPGVAVADNLRAKGHQAVLLLSDKRVDREAADDLDHVTVTLPSAAWQKAGRLKFFGRFAKGLLACRTVFKEHQPHAVMAMGGFTSLSPILLARMQCRPVFLHESNTIAGRAVRTLAPWAKLGFLGFECASTSLPGLKCEVTGTPVRESLRNLDRDQCCRKLGFQPDKLVLLVTGGSQGALGINRCVISNLSLIKVAIPNLQVLHLCGLHESLDRIRAEYQKWQIEAQVHSFFNRMDLALGASDAAIGRSGASFMAELAATRVPSLLIPFPKSADGHQLENAKTLAKVGAALYLEEDQVNGEKLTSCLKALLLDPENRLKMQSALAGLDHPDSAEQIVTHILKMLGYSVDVNEIHPSFINDTTRRIGSDEPQSLSHSPSLS